MGSISKAEINTSLESLDLNTPGIEPNEINLVSKPRSLMKGSRFQNLSIPEVKMYLGFSFFTKLAVLNEVLK